MVRMGSEPFDEINVILGSGVIENRVIGVRRTFRMDPAEMPAPAAIRAQLVEQYGEPSIETGNAMLYAYDENGFIESLEDASQALEPSSGHTGWNGITLASDTPCIFLNPPGFKPTPNKKEPSAESCKGVFEVKIECYRANFALYDFTLDAFNQAETDRQIDEALAVETPAADMKL